MDKKTKMLKLEYEKRLQKQVDTWMAMITESPKEEDGSKDETTSKP